MGILGKYHRVSCKLFRDIVDEELFFLFFFCVEFPTAKTNMMPFAMKGPKIQNDVAMKKSLWPLVKKAVAVEISVVMSKAKSSTLKIKTPAKVL